MSSFQVQDNIDLDSLLFPDNTNQESFGLIDDTLLPSNTPTPSSLSANIFVSTPFLNKDDIISPSFNKQDSSSILSTLLQTNTATTTSSLKPNTLSSTTMPRTLSSSQHQESAELRQAFLANAGKQFQTVIPNSLSQQDVNGQLISNFWNQFSDNVNLPAHQLAAFQQQQTMIIQEQAKMNALIYQHHQQLQQQQMRSSPQPNSPMQINLSPVHQPLPQPSTTIPATQLIGLPANFGNNFLSSASAQFAPSPPAFLTSPSIINGTTSAFATSSSIPISQPLIRLVEGFHKPVKKKQPGGKDNTKNRIPRQVIELNTAAIPSQIPITSLSVQASVLGFDKVSKQKMVLGALVEKRFVETGSGVSKRWLAIFDSLIIKYSSHLHGQKLALRFCLVDSSKRTICEVDSEEFETITTRGKTKQEERVKRKRGDENDTPTVETCDPEVGPTFGGTLVKIGGTGFVATPLGNVVVKFGDCVANEIHCVKRNIILCETPENEPGKVQVNVSFDSGKTMMQSEAYFTYVDSNTSEGMSQIVKSINNPKKTNDYDDGQEDDYSNDGNMSDHGTGSADGGASSDFSGLLQHFALGTDKDAFGFSILHRACANGFFELVCVLLQKQLNIHELDNYGRTPLYWAMYSNSAPIISLLLTEGAELDLEDEFLETPLHMAANYCHPTILKTVAYWLLKYDDKEHANCKTLHKLLQVANENGKTPVDVTTNEEMKNLLQQLHRVTEQLLDKDRMKLSDIVIKSGPQNSKTTNSILGESTQYQLSLSKDYLAILIKKQDGNLMRALVPHNKIAFLILETKSQKAEFTLHSQPIVQQFESKSKQWINASKDVADLFALQFHAITSMSTLEQLNHFYSKQDSEMLKFRDYCFTQKPQPNQTQVTQKLSELSLSNETKEKQQQTIKEQQ